MKTRHLDNFATAEGQRFAARAIDPHPQASPILYILGAGVAGHLHLHALPRWAGDTNFMTTVAETRILPEDLATTWKRMREAFGETGSD